MSSGPKFIWNSKTTPHLNKQLHKPLIIYTIFRTKEQEPISQNHQIYSTKYSTKIWYLMGWNYLRERERERGGDKREMKNPRTPPLPLDSNQQFCIKLAPSVFLSSYSLFYFNLFIFFFFFLCPQLIDSLANRMLLSLSFILIIVF